MSTKLKFKNHRILWVLMGVGIASIAGAAILMTLQSVNEQSISNFHECQQAGGRIAESYPEQCFIGGNSFVNTDQKVRTPIEGYVGLNEQSAIDKAKNENKQARVVERDGESLPVDASYAPGRLNFYVRDGKVVKLDIEGMD